MIDVTLWAGATLIAGVWLGMGAWRVGEWLKADGHAARQEAGKRVGVFCLPALCVMASAALAGLTLGVVAGAGVRAFREGFGAVSKG